MTLKNNALEVRVNSEARAAQIRSLLTPALAGLVREPLVERMTVEQAMAESPHTKTSAAQDHEGIDPAELRPAIQEVMTRHYRGTLDEPVPMLGGKSPRQAARSAKGRIALAKWLKGFEQHNARRPADDPMRDYDFGWMWEQLGIQTFVPERQKAGDPGRRNRSFAIPATCGQAAQHRALRLREHLRHR